MEHWLKRLRDSSQSELTKLTNHPSVSFVSANSEGSHKNIITQWE
jgi:hypothetical protein